MYMERKTEGRRDTDSIDPYKIPPFFYNPYLAYVSVLSPIAFFLFL